MKTALAVVAALTLVGAVYWTWWATTHHCAEYGNFRRERSCSNDYIYVDGIPVYSGETCTAAHWERECIRWERDR